MLEELLNARAEAQIGTFMALASKFRIRQYRSLCDIGGANATLSVCMARKHPQLECLSVDLPPVAAIAARRVKQDGLSRPVQVGAVNFLTDAFPKADVITMSNILSNWNLETKRTLIRKAHQALPDGGALVVIETVIDDERQHNTYGLLLSLNTLLQTEGGAGYTHAEFHGWAIQAGFKSTTCLPLTSSGSALIAYK